MTNENSFQYTYSTPVNQEVLSIRRKYIPQEETKLEELKRLDRLVQNSGVTESLIVGIGGCLVFGIAMCFGLGVFGHITWPSILLGLVGTVGMLTAYPINRKIFQRTKEKHAPRILELTAELIDNI